jgi:hypothetical protein
VTDDLAPLQFDVVVLTDEMVAAAEAHARPRASRRTQFRSLNDALAAHGVHSMSDQKVVRDWTREFFLSPAYRRMFMIAPPFVPRETATFDDALRLPGSFLEVWIPRSGGYLAIGGAVPMAKDEVADGNRIAAQVFKTHLEVLPLELVGETVPGEIRWFPGHDPQARQVGRVREVTCPTCSMLLPATGRCDRCTSG